MSFTPSVAPLSVELQPSRRFAALLLLAHGLAFVVCLKVPLPGVFRALMAAGVAISAWFYLSRDALLRRPESIVRVGLDGAGVWRLRLRDGQELQAQLAPGALVQPYLIALTFRTGPRRHRSVVLWPDSAPAESLRQLRVRLRAG